jgi:hypothetical protein
MPTGFIAGGTNWTYPLLQQINRQGENIMYADQARRANEQADMQKKNFLMQVEERLRARALDEQLKGTLSGAVDEEGNLDIKTLAGKIASFDPKSSLALLTKLEEINAKKEEVSTKLADTRERHKETIDLRRDIAEGANADRDASRAAIEQQRLAMNEFKTQQQKNEAERLRLEAERLEETKKKNLRDEQGTKPPKDYRWNANKELEPIPGSKTDVKIREDYASDTANIDRIEDTFNRTTKTIDELLKNENGLQWVTGYSGRAPDWVSQDKKDASVKLEELRSRIFVQAIEAMRSTAKTGSTGLGQMTEREGDKVQNSFANLEKAQSYEQMVAALKDIKSVIEASRARIKRQYKTEWEGREPKPLGTKQDWTPQSLDLDTQKLSTEELRNMMKGQ